MNNLRVELACRGLSGEPLELQFEDRGGWLLASIPCRGWFDQVPAHEQEVFEGALTGLYKMSGVELTREQIEISFADRPNLDLLESGLIIHAGTEGRMICRSRTERRPPGADGRGAGSDWLRESLVAG